MLMAFSMRSLKTRAGQQREATERKIFLAILAGAKLPLPTPQYAFAKPDRLWTFDYGWEAEKVALEVEGSLFALGAHSSPAGVGRDMNKYTDAAVRGWRILRCVPGDTDIVRRRRLKRDGKTGRPSGAVEYHVHALLSFSLLAVIRQALAVRT